MALEGGAADGRGIAVAARRDHDRIDGLIAAFRSAAGGRPWRQALEEAAVALRGHIEWEEQALFPAFAAREGQEAAVSVDGMIQQHREILRLLDDVAESPPGKPEERHNREEAFAQALEEHNEGEERYVYPWIDAVLTDDERAALMPWT